MVVVDKLTVEIEADTKKFNTNIDSSQKKLWFFASIFKKEAKWVKDSAESIWWGFAWLKWIIAWALSITAVIGFWKKLFQLWSDLEETQSKFNTVFWGIEEEARASFNAIADNVGRSRLEIEQFGAWLWDILKPLWFATEDASALSQEMVKLAIDVASFSNAQDWDVLRAFTSALTWERESLKTYGIVINEADIKTRALSDWVIKQGEELTKQQKALVTWGLLLDNTTDAQWDAIRTAWSFANQLKKLWGVIKDTFATAGREVAHDTASWLWTIADFIKIYWVAFIKSFVEIWKTIGSVFATAFEWIAWVFNWISWLLNDWEVKTMTWGDRFLWVLNRVNFWIKALLFVFKSLWKGIWAVLAAIVLTAQDAWMVFIDTWKLVIIAIWEAFMVLPNLIAWWLWKALNAWAKKLNWFLEKINSVFWTDYKISVDFDEWGWAKFWKTSALFWEIEARRRKIGQTITWIWADLNAEIKADALTLANEMEASEKKITDAVRDSEWVKQDAYDTSFRRFNELNDKYKSETTEWGKNAKKTAWETAKALEKAVDDQVKDLEKLKEAGIWAYWDIKDEIVKQKEKIVWLKWDYDKLSEKIKEVWEEWVVDIWKISDAIKKLEWDLKKIEWAWASDLVERQLEIQKELKTLSEGKRNDFTIEDYQKEAELKKELELINSNTTEEERLRLTEELQKSKTQKILDWIEAKKAETQVEIDALILKKEEKQKAIDEEIANLELLQTAKKAEILSEYEEYKKFITDKNTLEKAYLQAFWERLKIEQEKVESLTQKYNALAKAKAQAGYSWSVLQNATQNASNNASQSAFNTTQTKDIKWWSVNIYWDITNNNQGDLNSFTDNINSKINP